MSTGHRLQVQVSGPRGLVRCRARPPCTRRCHTTVMLHEYLMCHGQIRWPQRCAQERTQIVWLGALQSQAALHQTLHHHSSYAGELSAMIWQAQRLRLSSLRSCLTCTADHGRAADSIRARLAQPGVVCPCAAERSSRDALFQ